MTSPRLTTEQNELARYGLSRLINDVNQETRFGDDVLATARDAIKALEAMAGDPGIMPAEHDGQPVVSAFRTTRPLAAGPVSFVVILGRPDGTYRVAHLYRRPGGNWQELPAESYCVGCGELDGPGHQDARHPFKPAAPADDRGLPWSVACLWFGDIVRLGSQP
jgi:hypothetical protein